MSFPATGLKVLLDADNVDGESNGLLSSGLDVSTWKNTGTGVADFLSATFNTATRGKPKFKKNTDGGAVAFDGVFNAMVSLASRTALQFVHASGGGSAAAVFDLFLVLRRYGTSVQGQRHVFGNAGGGGDGLLVSLADYSLGAEGLVRLVLNSNGGSNQTVVLTNADIQVPIGAPYKLLVSADGVNLSVSHDFLNFQSTPIPTVPALGSTPGAVDYTIGGGFPSETAYACYSGEVLKGALYARNTTTAERLGILNDLVAEYGEGV